MAFRVTAGSSGFDLLIDTSGGHLVSSVATRAFLVHDGTVFTPAPLDAPAIVPSLASSPAAIAHLGGTGFFPTATLDHGVLATTGTMGSAVLAGTLAPLGDPFAHAINDWLMDLS